MGLNLVYRGHCWQTSGLIGPHRTPASLALVQTMQLLRLARNAMMDLEGRQLAARWMLNGSQLWLGFSQNQLS